MPAFAFKSVKRFAGSSVPGLWKSLGIVQVQKAVRWPCGVCGRGVGGNSMQCTAEGREVRPQMGVARVTGRLKFWANRR